MIPFDIIRARAVERKGGEAALGALLPATANGGELEALSDDRVLALMTKCIFRAGFVWRVIKQKWPGFEEAFLGFDARRLHFQADDFWHDLGSDKRIVRNRAKIMAVRDNAAFVVAVADAHGSFGRYLADWPEDDMVALWAELGKRGSRLGGMTGRYFTRFAGKDCFIPSRDVVAALREGGLDIAGNPTSKRDLTRIQDQFNAWATETGLPRSHLSRICAMAAGENIEPAVHLARTGAGDSEM